MKRSRGHALILGLALLAHLACDADADAGAGEDAAMDLEAVAWESVDADEDPYRSRRPDPVHCPPGLGYVAESYDAGPALEVYTGACNWLSVSQPAPVDLPAGATFTIRLWVIDLSAPSPAVATIGVAVDGAPVWAREVPIPSPTHMIVDTWTTDAPISAGAPIVFHIDNHGSNSYTLLELSAAG